MDKRAKRGRTMPALDHLTNGSQGTNTPNELPFGGFCSPTYTMVPDELFDELLAKLSGAELKVLLYIIRRTFGFKKATDSISIAQIMHGIDRRDGAALDRGTGLSKDSVSRAVKCLEERGVIVRQRRRSTAKGDEATTYALNVRSTEPLDLEHGPSAKQSPPPCPKIGHPPVRKSDTQQTVRQQRVKHHHPHTPSSAPAEVYNERADGDDVQDLVLQLQTQGVSPGAARTLSRRYSVAQIQGKLEILSYLKKTGSVLVSKNPAGWLRRAIEEDYPPPAEYLRAKQVKQRQQRQQEMQDQISEEALVQRTEELSIPPAQRAERWLKTWERGQRTLGRRVPSAAERAIRKQELITQYTQERDQFFTDHPSLRPAAAPSTTSINTSLPARHRPRAVNNDLVKPNQLPSLQAQNGRRNGRPSVRGQKGHERKKG